MPLRYLRLYRIRAGWHVTLGYDLERRYVAHTRSYEERHRYLVVALVRVLLKARGRHQNQKPMNEVAADVNAL